MLHQVNSSPGRNLAVNVWTDPLVEFDEKVGVSDLTMSSLKWHGLPDIPDYNDPVPQHDEL